jgi:hypothetical protein
MLLVEDIARYGFLVITGLMGMIFLLFDEPLHRKRGLLRWERISHLVDAVALTLTYFVGFAAASFPSVFSLLVLYGLVAILTVGLSYKDEFIHKEACSAWENLVHALMFTLLGGSLSFATFVIASEGDAWPLLVAGVAGLLAVVGQLLCWFSPLAPAEPT